MRGKKAKRLRCIANDATTGLPEVAYRRAYHRYGRVGPDGKRIAMDGMPPGQFMILHQLTTRATYKRLKRLYRRRRLLWRALNPIVAGGMADRMGRLAQHVFATR